MMQALYSGASATLHLDHPRLQFLNGTSAGAMTSQLPVGRY